MRSMVRLDGEPRRCANSDSSDHHKGWPVVQGQGDRSRSCDRHCGSPNSRRNRSQSNSVGDSERLEVGDFVVAVGNPFGLGQTVTSGLVSALGRTGLGKQGYEDFIQTDASIIRATPVEPHQLERATRRNKHGNPLAGRGNVGIGFAVPIIMARKSWNKSCRLSRRARTYRRFDSGFIDESPQWPPRGRPDRRRCH
jgi:hypothetical protein